MCGISVASGTPATSAASAGARVRMSLTTACGRISSSSGSSARAASAAWAPSGESGSGGGNMRYSSAAAKPRPAPSTAARRSSQVSIVTSWPRPASARPRAIAGKTCPGSPKAATRKRLGGVKPLAWSGEDNLGHVAVGRDVQQERTASPMSSGRIISSPGTCPLANSVIGVSTKPGASAVHWMPALPTSRWVDWVKLITAPLVAA